MKSLKRCLMAMGVGITLLVGLTNCVVAPVAPVHSGYIIAPPPVVIRPYRPYRPYYSHRPYYPHGRHSPYRYRW